MSRALWLSYAWTPEHQEISVDGERFAHPGEINTAPSHDVAHLLAAAAGLSWRPSGARDQICFSELNAVLLERLGLHAFESVVLGSSKLEDAIAHARWFVTEHYAPFPVPFDEALARFRRLDALAVVRLVPVFFRARAFELSNEDHRARTFGASFSSAFDPDRDGAWADPRRAFAAALAALG